MSVTCQICNEPVHFIELHLKKSHADVSLADYVKQFPDAPLFSKKGEQMLEEKLKQWGENKKVLFNISEVFGSDPFPSGKVKSVWGWEKPTTDVPELEDAYSFRSSLLAVVLYAIENAGEPCLLIGPTGSGKTSVYEQVCARVNRPVVRINLDGDVTRSDFVGQWVLNGQNTMEFHYGPLPVAMKEGKVLIIDEIDAGASPVMMVIQAVLEGKPLVLLETGETIYPHPDFRLVATANTNGQGDESGMYNGTQPQNYALMDRFRLTEIVDYPTVEEEHAILEKKLGMTNAGGNREKLIKVANMIRAAHKKGETVCTMSTRNVINIAQKLIAFGNVKRAYEVAFLNKMNSADKDVCHELVQRVWG